MAQPEIAVGERGFCAPNRPETPPEATDSLLPPVTEKFTPTHEICGLGLGLGRRLPSPAVPRALKLFDNVDDAIQELSAFGCHLEPEEVEPVLKKGLSSKKTVIMDFVVEKEECVYPMIPAGAAATEMLLV